MNENQIPRGPWYNPYLSDGAYAAIVEETSYTTYGDSGGHVLQVVFWIPSEELYFTTNIYLPNEYTRGAHMRLWHLFRSTEVELDDPEHDATFLEGKTLRLIITQNNSKASSVNWSYSDVAEFLHMNEEIPSDGTLAATTSWISPICDVV